MTTRAVTPLTIKQRLFLALGIPALLLGAIEISARVVLAFTSESKPNAPVALEMPTWMLKDANAVARRKPSEDAVDWLQLFKEGTGYRVHLEPNVSRAVKNTFSLIPADEDRRYLIKSNSLGFRGPELSPKKPENGFRVLVFGDSSSFGWGVNAEDSWSVLLQEELSKRYPDRVIEVGNFAIPGDSTAYGQLLFETFAPRYESDLVIFGFGANDAKGVFTSHTDQVARFSEKKGLLAVAGVLRWSAAYRLLETAVTKAGTKTPDRTKRRKRVPAVSQGEYAKNLRDMGRTARSLGAKNSMLLSLCTPKHYAKRAKHIARKEDFLWFNGQNALTKALPRIKSGELYPSYVEEMKRLYPRELRRNSLFYVTSDGCHPNELGHRFVADNLTRIVSESGVIN